MLTKYILFLTILNLYYSNITVLFTIVKTIRFFNVMLQKNILIKLLKNKSSYKTECPSPDGNGILLWWGSPQKI